MRRHLVRAGLLATFLVVITAGSLALLADGTEGGGFQACPWPPCAAPCVLDGEPEVLCKTPGGPAVRTTFTCCCCGSGQSSFKRLR